MFTGSFACITIGSPLPMLHGCGGADRTVHRSWLMAHGLKLIVCFITDSVFTFMYAMLLLKIKQLTVFGVGTFQKEV